MDNLHKTIDGLCRQNGTNITQMCNSIGISRSAISELKSGRTKNNSANAIIEISKYFNIDMDFFDRDYYAFACSCCGLHYNANDPEENKEHEERHERWRNAVKKYGFCWTYEYRENVKAKARYAISLNNSNNDEGDDSLFYKKLSSSEIIKNYELIFKAYFSRSLEASGYSLTHLSFPDFCAGLLGQEDIQKKMNINNDIYALLVDKYGASNAIPQGTYYNNNKLNITKNNKKTSNDGSIDNNSKIFRSETDHIKKYRTLDKHGKKIVNLVLDEEYSRCTVPKENEEKVSAISIKCSVYKVSAGHGFPLDEGDNWNYIDVPDTPLSRQADFALTISGDSMEPIYHDGDVVLVQSQPDVPVGAVGIFVLDGAGYIKKNGGDRLISLNEQYDDIILSEDHNAAIVGRVIGRI